MCVSKTTAFGNLKRFTEYIRKDRKELVLELSLL